MTIRKLDTFVALAAFAAWSASAPAAATFQITESGMPSNLLIETTPGGMFSIDVLALTITAEGGVGANLDSFTYRMEFPNEEFALEANMFGAPFDNSEVPAGFNGSVPWADGASVPIDDGADAGSPLNTPLTPDLYRTTASTMGVPGAGPDLLVETLTLTAPSPPMGSLPVEYAINLNILEAADGLGSFHTADNGEPFIVRVVPEPASLLLLAAGAGLAIRRRRFR